MPTLEENVNRVKAAKTAIGNAITAKGGTVGANDGLEDFAADIATIPSGGGGGSQPRKDVNFYDYDGTIVNSYTAADFANLSELPANPTHEGLTAQGWNWSLSDAKSYVASYGKLEIGQMYITSDGKTRLYITLTEGRTSPVLKLYLNANSELDIDWGDGSTHSTFTSTSAEYKSERHDYSTSGDYVIAITVNSGSFIIKGTTQNYSELLSNADTTLSSPNVIYNSSIKKIELGANIDEIGDYAFTRCSSLKSITIPRSITKFGNYSFSYTTALLYITLPNNINSMVGFVLSYSGIEFISLPYPFVDYKVFNSCSGLRAITLPKSVTKLNDNSFSGCSSLSSILIPNSVTTMTSGVFINCYSLATITIDKAEGSISGSPWGAITSSPSYTQIIWTGE